MCRSEKGRTANHPNRVPKTRPTKMGPPNGERIVSFGTQSPNSSSSKMRLKSNARKGGIVSHSKTMSMRRSRIERIDNNSSFGNSSFETSRRSKMIENSSFESNDATYKINPDATTCRATLDATCRLTGGSGSCSDTPPLAGSCYTPRGGGAGWFVYGLTVVAALSLLSPVVTSSESTCSFFFFRIFICCDLGMFFFRIFILRFRYVFYF